LSSYILEWHIIYLLFKNFESILQVDIVFKLILKIITMWGTMLYVLWNLPYAGSFIFHLHRTFLCLDFAARKRNIFSRPALGSTLSFKMLIFGLCFVLYFKICWLILVFRESKIVLNMKTAMKMVRWRTFTNADST
jgi:hypothetical protein